jgi:hypothetical protein
MSPGGDYYAYSVSNFFDTTFADVMAATSSEIPLRFFQHVTAGLPAGFFSQLELVPGYPAFPPRLCSQFLSIIRPDESNDKCVPRTTVRLFTSMCPPHDDSIYPITENQLATIMAHHYSSQVMLELPRRFDWLPLDRVNDLLHENQHLCHLKVPYQLFNFDSSADSFTSNSHFRSLEFMHIWEGSISLKLLDGFALNTGLKDVIFGFSMPFHGPFQAAHLEKLTHLFGNVLPKCCSLSNLTLHLNDPYPESSGPQTRHAFYEEITRCIATSSPMRAKDPFGSVSSIKVTYTTHVECIASSPPTGANDQFGSLSKTRRIPRVAWPEEKHVLPPNATWDRLVSPSLLLTWCRKQRIEHSANRIQPLGLIVEAIRQINQNVAYWKTSHAAPHDSRIANASAIYDSICTFHPDFGRQM